MLRRCWAVAERGDTIVEVLIVLAVLGLAIGISYATANRSLLNARQAQENSMAAELVQSQVETLKSLVSNGASAPAGRNIFQPGPYCLATGANPVVPLSGTALTTYSSYPAVCVQHTFYHLSVVYDSVSDTFTAKAVWDDVLGQGQDTVTLVYKLYPYAYGAGITAGGGGGASCPVGQTGTPPNCQTPTCPVGQTGTPPNCQTPTCPVGQTGTPPNCQTPTCPVGQTGTPPACGTCPWYETGTYPDCHAASL